MPDRIINETFGIIRTHVEAAFATNARRPLVIGLAGAQGSGKSTLATLLVEQLARSGYCCAGVSLDDFYLSRAERRRAASAIHPLFVTRGPPGTHDIARALDFMSAIREGRRTRAPVFDKASDEPRAEDAWRDIPQGIDVLVFEGWCIGARPQPFAALASPVNMLELNYDARGEWRRTANDALAGAYRDLFETVDSLVYLRAPSFKIVQRWRCEQEKSLHSGNLAAFEPGRMTAQEISFFIQHFERITRWMMDDLPARAMLTIQLDEKRRPVAQRRAATHSGISGAANAP